MTALKVVRDWCQDAGVEWEQTSDRDVIVVLPGEQKLRTTVAVSVGVDTVTVNAFVIRHPDEDTDRVHRWLLERNRRIFALAYAIDQYGDIFLVGTLPTAGFDAEVMDRLMGSVLQHADLAFNTLLELGFSTAIRAEWAWRLKAGESTANLAAFRHLAPDEPTAPDAD